MGARALVLPLALCLLAACGTDPDGSGATLDPPEALDVSKGETGLEDSDLRPTPLDRARVVARGSDGFLTLRSTPGTDRGERVVELPDGTEVGVYRCRDDIESADGAQGAWCRVRTFATDGWVFDAYLTPASGDGTARADVNDFLAIRSAPTTRSGRQRLRLLPGAEVSVGECEPGPVTLDGKVGQWCEVTVRAQEGWVFGAFLEPVGG